MQQTILVRLFRDSVHGGVLKAFALLARVVFLLFVIPGLLKGELASYVFINSTALIVATFAILGLNEDLPRVVAGDAEKARPFLFWFLVAQCFLVLAIGALIFSPSTIAACAVFSGALIAGRYIGGLIRSIDVRVAERLSNLPWIVFLAITLALGLNTAFELIVTMAVSMSIAQWHAYLSIRLQLKSGTNTGHISLKALIRHGLRHGLSRLLSTVCLIGAVRGFVLWPVWLKLPYDIDQIAFAITASEIVTQFGLVPVNRAYARWCRTREFSQAQVRQAMTEGVAIVLVLFSLATVAIYLIEYLRFMPPQVESTSILLQAVGVAALLPVFHLFRFLLLSKNILLGWLAIVTFVLFISAGLTALIFPIEYWFAVLAVCLAIACVGTAIKSFSMVARFNVG